MFDKLRKYLNGEFICIGCGKIYYSMGIFGFGECICPHCYSGEKKFFFPDKSFWLNRRIKGISVC